MKESLKAHASKGKKSCVLSCRQLDRNRREKKEEVKKIQEISIFVNILFFFLFRESWSGSEGGGGSRSLVTGGGHTSNDSGRLVGAGISVGAKS